MIIMFPVGFTLGLLIVISFPNDRELQAILNLIVMFATIPIYIFILRKVLSRGISGYYLKVFKRCRTRRLQ